MAQRIAEGINSTNQDQLQLRLNPQAAAQRVSLSSGRGKSRPGGFLRVVVLGPLLIGCSTIANPLPPGPAASIPPEHVVVFGRIEVKSDLTCSDYYQPVDLPVCQKYFKIPWLEDMRGKEGTLKISFVDIPFKFGEDFYAVFSKSSGHSRKDKSWGYFFEKVESPEFRWPVLLGTDPYWIDCRGIFTVPDDASAVYVGTIVLEISKRPDKFKKGPRPAALGHVTVSIEDDFNQALNRLQGRNPDFPGRIVKSLFRDYDWSGSSVSESALRDAECRIEAPRGFIIPII